MLAICIYWPKDHGKVNEYGIAEDLQLFAIVNNLEDGMNRIKQKISYIYDEDEFYIEFAGCKLNYDILNPATPVGIFVSFNVYIIGIGQYLNPLTKMNYNENFYITNFLEKDKFQKFMCIHRPYIDLTHEEITGSTFDNQEQKLFPINELNNPYLWEQLIPEEIKYSKDKFKPVCPFYYINKEKE